MYPMCSSALDVQATDLIETEGKAGERYQGTRFDMVS